MIKSRNLIDYVLTPGPNFHIVKSKNKTVMNRKFNLQVSTYPRVLCPYADSGPSGGLLQLCIDSEFLDYSSLLALVAILPAFQAEGIAVSPSPGATHTDWPSVHQSNSCVYLVQVHGAGKPAADDAQEWEREGGTLWLYHDNPHWHTVCSQALESARRRLHVREGARRRSNVRMR